MGLNQGNTDIFTAILAAFNLNGGVMDIIFAAKHFSQIKPRFIA